jgi:hypothetical protein
MEAKLAITVLLTVSILIATTAIHFESLRGLWHAVAKGGENRRLKIIVALPAVIFVHLIEIGLYAGVYALAIGPLQLGHFAPLRPISGLDLVYYAAETYSALGYGDILPVGYLRLIVSVSPLNGLLLLASSGSFLFLLIQDDFVDNLTPDFGPPDDSTARSSLSRPRLSQCQRHREEEGGAAAGAAFNPDLATQVLDDTAADGEA